MKGKVVRLFGKDYIWRPGLGGQLSLAPEPLSRWLEWDKRLSQYRRQSTLYMDSLCEGNWIPTEEPPGWVLLR